MSTRAQTDKQDLLTPREQEVLVYLTRAMTNREIAEAMTLSLATVKWYVRQLLRKLNVTNRQAAVRHARKQGLLPIATVYDRGLPLAPTPFIGREAEIAELQRVLASSDCRLATIVGPGGVGKTRLAVRVGRSFATVAAGPIEQIEFIDLSEIADSSKLAAAIATAVGFSHGQAVKGTVAERRLFDYLRQKRLLLILDNYEHLLPDVRLLQMLLRSALDLKLLVTSRERLQLQEEHVVSLAGLHYPSPEGYADQSYAQVFRNYDAFALFVSAAGRTAAGYSWQHVDIRELARLCKLVDGHPLALELAAGWIDLLSLPSIVAELEQDLRRLRSRWRNTPPRHAHLAATIDGSWKRLGPSEQALLMRLAIFRTHFTRAAAQAVCAPERSLTELIDLFERLASRSLLRYRPDVDRYDLHPVLRAYAKNRLEVSGAEQTAAAHAAYFANLALTHGARIHSADQPNALLELVDMLEEIEAAVRWLTQQNQWPTLDAMLDCIGELLNYQGDASTGCRLFAGVTNALDARATSDRPHGTIETQITVRAAAWLAYFSQANGDVARATRLLSRIDNLLDQTHTAGAELRLLTAWVRSRLNFTTGALHISRPDLESCLTGVGSDGDPHRRAQILYDLGVTAYRQDEVEQAHSYLQQSLQLYRGLGHAYGETVNQNMLAWVQAAAGRYGEAQTLFEEALTTNRRHGFSENVLHNLAGISWIMLAHGRLDAMLRLAGEHLPLAQHLGQHALLARSHEAAGLANLHLGRWQLAEEHLDAALRFAEASGYESRIGRVMLSLSKLKLALRRYPESAHFVRQSVAICRRYPGHRDRVVQGLVVSGRVAAALGDPNSTYARMVAATTAWRPSSLHASSYLYSGLGYALSVRRQSAAHYYERCAALFPLVARSAWFSTIFFS